MQNKKFFWDSKFAAWLELKIQALLVWIQTKRGTYVAPQPAKVPRTKKAAAKATKV